MLGLGELPEDEATPNYNVAPSQPVRAVRLNADGRLEMVRLRWGLVPSWSKGPNSRYSMINARSETVHQKPAYRTAFRRRRCLIPADGFYEWKKTESGKQPYFICRRDRRPLAFAGLWEHWERGGEGGMESCAIIVTVANSVIRPVHDRMPVILSAQEYGRWLDPRNEDPEELLPLLSPCADAALEVYPVSRRVNSPRNQGADLLRAVPDAEE